MKIIRIVKRIEPETFQAPAWCLFDDIARESVNKTLNLIYSKKQLFLLWCCLDGWFTSYLNLLETRRWKLNQFMRSCKANIPLINRLRSWHLFSVFGNHLHEPATIHSSPIDVIRFYYSLISLCSKGKWSSLMEISEWMRLICICLFRIACARKSIKIS